MSFEKVTVCATATLAEHAIATNQATVFLTKSSYLPAFVERIMEAIRRSWNDEVRDVAADRLQARFAHRPAGDRGQQRVLQVPTGCGRPLDADRHVAVVDPS